MTMVHRRQLQAPEVSVVIVKLIEVVDASVREIIVFNVAVLLYQKLELGGRGFNQLWCRDGMRLSSSTDAVICKRRFLIKIVSIAFSDTIMVFEAMVFFSAKDCNRVCASNKQMAIGHFGWQLLAKLIKKMIYN